MSREEQIKNMTRAIHLNCHKGLTSTEAEMIAKWCYQEIDRASLKNARNIFGNFRILAHVDFDGNICIRKDSFDKLEKQYTEEQNNG